MSCIRMNKNTVNLLFVVFYFVQEYYNKIICKNVWLTITSFIIMASFIIYTIIKKDSKKDYLSLAFGLIAIISEVLWLIHYN